MENTNYNAKNIRTEWGMVLYRQSRRTPLKQGAFVAVWKRNLDGETIPYNHNDLIDFYVIEDESKEHYFCFPRTILIEKGIMSSPKHKGKRGFRLYAPDLVLTSVQAKNTQAWQKAYFYQGPYPVKCQ